MKRQFKRNEKGKRLVFAKTYKWHLFHPECAPKFAVDIWVRTEKSACHGCGGALWKSQKGT